MGEVINLRRARKVKQRQESTQRAAEARVLHGRTKAERVAGQGEQDRFARHLEHHRRTAEPSGTKPASDQDADGPI